MSQAMPVRDQDLLRRLRRMRVLLIHPDNGDRRILLAHLKRIGCQVESMWPAPEILPEHTDVVLFLLTKLSSHTSLSWLAGDDSMARIAIISFETPEILSELERLSVHGILTTPIRIFGMLAALTTAIGLARYEARLKRRVRSLDETLKSRRKIEQAVAILTKSREMTEEDAYKRLRNKSQSSQTSIAAIAEAIIASADI